jgi:hypothetical protein
MPYPNSSAVPDVPGDILLLAQEVDDTLTAEFGALQTPGYVPMVPTAVSGSGVSVNAVGLVSFASSTSIVVDGCFTSAFRNYRVEFESSGTAATVLFQFRLGGSTISTANYDRTELLARNAGVSSSTSLAGTSWTLLGFANTLIHGDVDISAPFVATATTALTRAGTHANPAASNISNGIVQNYLTHRLATAYDGFVITLSGAQSGTLRVFGKN